VHHPPPPDWERQRVRNDDSLVMELRFGDVSMLLAGDIGHDVEQSLLPLLDPRPLVVLKVPHHGSATSSSASFLERLHPAIALIGVGRANSYGHPVRAVIDRLHTAGARVFRTDRDGQIDVATDGHSLYVETFTATRWTSRASHEGAKARKE
jgi:competence protein ComEC